MSEIESKYQIWLEKATEDFDIAKELIEMADDETKKEDSFYRELEFGTGGLRGVIGAGTNRMNIYTVAKASQGLANYVKEQFQESQWSIAVSYDSRIKADIFAQTAASVFAANGIRVHIFRQLMPTPCLSFAVRELNCAAGIMVTASHNPAIYNGYKVYGTDGCQITTEAAELILSEIDKVNAFADVSRISFEEGQNRGMIHYITDEVEATYIENVKQETLLSDEAAIEKDVAIVYTPLNGAGLRPVLRTLKESGYTNITVVKEQEQPDGNFPTCPFPNPEIKEAMALGMEYAEKCNSELLLATDPDCDRVGIAVKEDDGFVLITGNETGMLLLDYICARRIENGTMPADPVMIKTIVTIDMAERIAKHYGVRTINVLTGFKFIGEQIGFLEAEGKTDSYIFGFEESYGYLSGSYVRDKDAVNGAFLICEMFAYYKSRGISLIEKLKELYETYGYTLNTLYSYSFEGSSGAEKMAQIMKSFRGDIKGFAGREVLECLDYSVGINGLPKSNVLKFRLEGNSSIVIRPSGTEPKMKAYISVSGENEAVAREAESKIATAVKEHIEG